MALVKEWLCYPRWGRAYFPGMPLESYGFTPVKPPRINLRPGAVNYVTVYKSIDHAAQCMVEGRSPQQENDLVSI